MLQYENIWVDASHPLCQALTSIMNTLVVGLVGPEEPHFHSLFSPYPY